MLKENKSTFILGKVTIKYFIIILMLFIVSANGAWTLIIQSD